MKTITQERILKALDKVLDYSYAKPETYVVSSLSCIGLHKAFDTGFGDAPSPINAEAKLELAYQGFTDPEKVLRRLSQWKERDNITNAKAIHEAWVSSFYRTLAKGWKREDKIKHIQVKYNISGLEQVQINLGGVILKHHRIITELVTLPDDWNLVESERNEVALDFIKACDWHNLTIYRYLRIDNQANWIEVEAQSLKRSVLQHRWVKVWEENCFDENCARYEFHLSTGSSLDPESDKNSISFCARIGKPSF